MNKTESCISLMRRLSATSFTALEDLNLDDPKTALGCLADLKNNFGAVIEKDNQWKLSYQPQWLDADLLRFSLPSLVMDETMSTHDVISSGYTPPFFIFTEHQQNGQGRRSKQWLALPGDAIMMSALFYFSKKVEGLSVAIGAVLWKRLLGHRVGLRLKWPNDLLTVDGHKVAGILVKTVGPLLIISVGVNLNLTTLLEKRVADMGGRAGALLKLRPDLSRQDCALCIAKAVQEVVENFDSGFKPYQELAIQAHIIAVGQPLSIIRQGKEKTQEVFQGIATDGALLTSQNQRVYRYYEGDISCVVSS